jgi:hypothetical protein
MTGTSIPCWIGRRCPGAVSEPAAGTGRLSLDYSGSVRERGHPDFQRAFAVESVEALRQLPHSIRHSLEPLHVARANVFGLTVQATLLPERPRVERTEGCLNAVDDETLLYPPAQGDLELLFDFGREVVGYVELELEAPEGTILDFNGFEYLDPVQPERVQWTHGLNNTFRYVARGGWQRYRSISAWVSVCNAHGAIPPRQYRAGALATALLLSEHLSL